MEHLGFIQDMMDVKVLILFVAARLKGAATVQELYELAYQDERLSYFDVCTAVPEMVQSGHLQQLPGARYRITEISPKRCGLASLFGKTRSLFTI